MQKLTKKQTITAAVIVSITVVAIALAVLFAPKAEAEGGYMGASGNYIDTPLTNHTGVTLHGGYNFNDFLGLEGRYLVNSSEEGYQGASVEIDSLYGIYLVGTVPVTDSLGVYVVFGHSRAEVRASYYYDSETASESSSSLGFGIKYDLVEAWTVNAEYTELFDNIDQFNVGLKLNF